MVPAGAYQGLTLTAQPDSTRAQCATNNVLWVNTPEKQRFIAPGRVTTVASDPVMDCQDTTLRIEFTAPVSTVSISLLAKVNAAPAPSASAGASTSAAPSANLASATPIYRLVAEDVNGGHQTAAVTGSPEQPATQPFVATGAMLRSVTISPQTVGSGTLVAITALTVG